MQNLSTKNRLTESIQKTNWKAILFFTSFTFLLWLILQFTKTHTVNYPIRIVFEDIPVKEILEKEEVILSASIKQSGFSLFKKQFTTPIVYISLAELTKVDSVYSFQSSVYIAQIVEQLTIPQEDLVIKNEEVIIPFSIKSTKKVPIHFNVNLSYAKSYASYQGIQFETDSVKIAGTLEEIATITKVETEMLELENLRNDASGELNFITSFTESIALDKLNVEYNIKVDKFSEKQFSIPVQLINAPSEFDVNLIPNEVTVHFQSSLEELDGIEADDFEVVCDYSAALEQAFIVVPRLVKKPTFAIRVKIEPNRIEYILRK